MGFEVISIIQQISKFRLTHFSRNSNNSVVQLNVYYKKLYPTTNAVYFLLNYYQKTYGFYFHCIRPKWPAFSCLVDSVPCCRVVLFQTKIAFFYCSFSTTFYLLMITFEKPHFLTFIGTMVSIFRPVRESVLPKA